jgi:hypothetical protein
VEVVRAQLEVLPRNSLEGFEENDETSHEEYSCSCRNSSQTSLGYKKEALQLSKLAGFFREYLIIHLNEIQRYMRTLVSHPCVLLRMNSLKPQNKKCTLILL